MEDAKELILVYNANSGFFNTIRDGLHKVLSPSTYQCNLCALTYSTLKMKDEWRVFISRLKIPSKFLHRDEFLRMLETHPHNIIDIEFPAVFLRAEEKVSLLITSEEIARCKTLKDLMNLITKSLSGIES